MSEIYGIPVERPATEQYALAAQWAASQPRSQESYEGEIKSWKAQAEIAFGRIQELNDGIDNVVGALTEIQAEQACKLFHTEAQLVIREGQYVRASDATRAVRRELESFQEQVRDALLELHEAGDLQDEQVDEILENLDLPGRSRKYTVTVRVTQEIEVEVEATSEDEAAEKVDEEGYSGIQDKLDDYDWDFDVRHVTEA